MLERGEWRAGDGRSSGESCPPEFPVDAMAAVRGRHTALLALVTLGTLPVRLRSACLARGKGKAEPGSVPVVAGRLLHSCGPSNELVDSVSLVMLVRWRIGALLEVIALEVRPGPTSWSQVGPAIERRPVGQERHFTESPASCIEQGKGIA